MKLTEAQLRNIIRKEIRLMFEVKDSDRYEDQYGRPRPDADDDDEYGDDRYDYEPGEREEERSYGDMGPGPRGRTAPYGGADRPGRLRGKMEESRRSRRRR